MQTEIPGQNVAYTTNTQNHKLCQLSFSLFNNEVTALEISHIIRHFDLLN